MGIGNPVAIGVVCGQEAADLTEARAQRLCLAASALTDMRTGLLQASITSPLDKLKGLPHNEQLSLSSLNPPSSPSRPSSQVAKAVPTTGMHAFGA